MVALLFCAIPAWTQLLPRSEDVADAAMKHWPAANTSASNEERWKRDHGLLLEGLEAEWLGTANPSYFNYVASSVDALIASDGSIEGHVGSADSLDRLALGRDLLLLYGVTRQEKYYRAAAALRAQLAAQPRNASGGFGHDRTHPGRMDVEDLYNAEPFYAEYGNVFQEPQVFSDVTLQFVLFDKHARDVKTGLLNQGWDQDGKPDRVDGRSASSPATQAACAAWYIMALVDALPWYPRNDPGRATLLALLRRTAEAIAREEDGRPVGRHEASGVAQDSGKSMLASTAYRIAYAFAKAARLGYLPEGYAARAAQAFRRVAEHLPSNRSENAAGNEGRMGDDAGAAGALLLASRELEVAPLAKLGRGKLAVMDAWFNSQQRKNAAGKTEYFHYKWGDYADSGFSVLGHLFNDYGVETTTLYDPPTAANLRSAQFYLIVSPDIPVKNPNPHYMRREDAGQIAAWVRRGGILLMMENDPADADITHMDILADRFGLHFNPVLSHHVNGDEYAMGRIDLAGGGELFDRPHVFYMKDTCTLSLSVGARPLLTDKGDTMMATAGYGKGTVFAVVDPWLYNEYTDGRKLPPEYDNLRGAQALVGWLLSQIPAGAARQVH
jgi:unsaturated rhamnogalacturonyl hydrolase